VGDERLQADGKVGGGLGGVAGGDLLEVVGDSGSLWQQVVC
jgi:hypothetical protein